MNKQDIYEWMLDNSRQFIINDDDDGGEYLDTDAMVDRAFELFSKKVSDDHYREHTWHLKNKPDQPVTRDAKVDFFAEIGASVEEGYY